MNAACRALHDHLSAALRDIDAGWSIGSFGAIGEFHQRPDDIRLVDDPERLIRASEKGGIRLDGAALAGAHALAYETLSPRAHRWGLGLALCLPEAQAAMSGCTVLTELGPDEGALRAEDRGALLFDMGLGQLQVDFCIRTRDPELIAILRAGAGGSVLAPGNAAMAAILYAHPHRVVISRLGRVEVYQKIGGPATGGVSPDGPHTHVLPKLLKSGRSHSANIPVPEGFVPCAYLHPASPVAGPQGEDIAYDASRQAAFEELLATYGPDGYLAVRGAVLAACAAGDDPSSFTEPATRTGRIGLRNTLRQIARAAESTGDAARLAWARRWQAVFDQSGQHAEDMDADNPGHEGEPS